MRRLQFGDLFFERAQPQHQFRELLHRDPLPFGLFVGHGRDAEHGFLGRDVAHDPGLGSNDGLRAELEVSGDA